MAGDQQIIAPGRQAPALQGRSDVSGMIGGGVIEREYFDPSGEALHLILDCVPAARIWRFVQKFGEHNRGGAKAVSLEVEPLPDLWRPISQHPDAKVRVALGAAV